VHLQTVHIYRHTPLPSLFVLMALVQTACCCKCPSLFPPSIYLCFGGRAYRIPILIPHIPFAHIWDYLVVGREGRSWVGWGKDPFCGSSCPFAFPFAPYIPIPPITTTNTNLDALFPLCFRFIGGTEGGTVHKSLGTLAPFWLPNFGLDSDFWGSQILLICLFGIYFW